VLPSKTSKTNSQPKWSQSKDLRFKDLGPRTPGPGSYDIRSKGVEGPYYSTRPKPKIHAELLAKGITAPPYKMTTKPGPGLY